MDVRLDVSLINLVVRWANARRLAPLDAVLALAAGLARVAERRGVPLLVVLRCVAAGYDASAAVGEDVVPAPRRARRAA